jgi:hypothetical protein
MRKHRRTAAALAALALAGAGLLALTACAPARSTGAKEAGQTVDTIVDLDAEQAVLAAAGFEAAFDPLPAASPSAGPDGDRMGRGPRRHAARVLLHGNTLHGEAVVQTKDGTKTVLVQRGTITAITDTTVSLKSSDGFTLTWTFGDKLRVVDRRTTVQPNALKAGDEIGVAGVKEGDKAIARLMVKKP